MHGHPSAAFDADGANLPCAHSGFGVNPDAGQSFHPARRHAPVCTRADDRFFQLAQVPADVGLELVEVEDGVRHQLAWAVVGDVSSAVDFVVFDPELGQAFRGDDDVAGVPALAEGQDVGVLHEQQVVFGPRKAVRFRSVHAARFWEAGPAAGDLRSTAVLSSALAGPTWACSPRCPGRARVLRCHPILASSPLR